MPDASHNQLKTYWTKGKGLAKWAPKPHPWTTLLHHLEKYLEPERARRVTTEWYHEVFGDYPGSDTARVRQGKPPRGKRIGPG